MTRKDYILIAEALRKAYAATPVSSELAIRLVTDALAANNRKFDREHFLAVVQGTKDLNSRPGKKSSGPDVQVENQGSIFLFRLQSQAAKEWVSENVQDDCQFFGGALVVEHSYVTNLIDGMQAAGLTVA